MAINQDVYSVLFKEYENNEIQSEGELMQMMNFLKYNGNPFTAEKIEGIYLLNSFNEDNEFTDLINYLYNVNSETVPVEIYYNMVNKLTLADRLKGNVKLSNVLKQPISNTNTNVSMDSMGSPSYKKR